MRSRAPTSVARPLFVFMESMMPDSDANIDPQTARNMDNLQSARERGDDPNGEEDTPCDHDFDTVKARNREYSRSESCLRFFSDRELLTELKKRGYGKNPNQG